LLAAGDAYALDAARYAIMADPLAEGGYQLLARVHRAEGNHSGVQRAVEECRAALGALGLEPTTATLALLSSGDG